MLALVCAAVVASPQVPLEQPPRLRTVLPSGAVVLVERVPSANSLVVGLFVSARSAPETPATHGYRHLIEHLVALGKDGKLDQALESKGGFVRAETFRDVTSFLFTVSPTDLKLALDGTASILGTRITSPALIAREQKVLFQEAALTDSISRRAVTAWTDIYGPLGLDSFGDLDVIGAAKAPVLESVRQSMFTPSNLTLVIAGDVDLDDATAKAKAILPTGKPPKGLVPAVRKPLPSATFGAREGGFIAVPVPGYRRPETTALLAAGLAIASELPSASLVYTPSGQPGVLMVGTEDGAIALDKDLEGLEPATLFERGRNMAKRWAKQRLSTPEGIASFRGALMADAPDLRPESMLENLENMTYANFEAAMKLILNAGKVTP